MIRPLVFLLLAAMPASTVLGLQMSSASVSGRSDAVTFNKDVLPILEKNCQTCHRPGQVAPMSFLTYESTRPWAKAIKAAVLSKNMPPWFADPAYGDFRNAPRLRTDDIQTLVDWVDSGAREGAAEDKTVETGSAAANWRIQPDVVISTPEPYRVRAKGEGEIKQFLVPNPFKEDTWVSAIEIRPGDPSVVHHVILQLPEETVAPEASFAWGLAGAVLGRVSGGAPRDVLMEGRRTGGNGGYHGGDDKRVEQATGVGTFATMEAVYAPGSQPIDFRFHRSAKLIRAGKQIRIEVHYTPNGKETFDQTRVAFTLAETPVQRRFVMMAPTALVDSKQPIPAGEANFERTGQLTFNEDVELVWFMPHMHLRGKDMTFRLIYPNGRSETLLSARFNFHWQFGYEVEEPLKVPRGTKMIVTAHYDNSAGNRNNPDPTKTVSWGELTSQEMMLPWFGVVVKKDIEPAMIASYRPGGATPNNDATSGLDPLQRLRLPTPPFATNTSRSGILLPAVRGIPAIPAIPKKKQ